ncbi:hypothetical protein IMZ31_19435 (plasmid) [Pontibacillus sp. ALD_SL1]|uniref:hypothetical protein n=1 Tax=Pontibacillus sp. ALD_SL1 TaxID=2777185 RepID=UPI001A96836D|nr:hypothetical protein [Pontibacillus sp. ALD_SL1]QST02724.1 hypothetical protein IMZ31_19435 [Pontibacillus sp. ALD_SL1]
MRTKRHRAILQAAGYQKRGEEYVKAVSCATCWGTGYKQRVINREYCQKCEGTGTIQHVTTILFEKLIADMEELDETLYATCRMCGGMGFTLDHSGDPDDCAKCDSSGFRGGNVAALTVGDYVRQYMRTYARTS